MQKLLPLLFALLWSPLGAHAGEFKAMVVKTDPAKNQIVVRTERGEEILQTKGIKGVEHAKEGVRVTIKINNRDGKVREIAPGD